MRRRDVIAGAGAASFGVSLLGAPVIAAESTRLPSELSAGTRQVERFADLPDKRRLLRLTDRPPNYETPIDAFTNIVTPNDRFYVRYHLAGVPSAADMDGWTLNVSGDGVTKPLRLRLSDLLDLPSSEVLAICQCAGNRRGLVQPHVAGVQWGDGAMGAAVWRGPALRDVLKSAGVKDEAVEVWLGGADKPVMDGTPPFRKSIPVDKAMDANTIVAIGMNNAPLPLLNGYPARLVVPGWVGTYWMKHLTTIEVSTTPLTNFWMKSAYRMPAGMFPVDHPFRSQETAATVPITELVVNSLIADPLEGHEVDRTGFTISGVAWDRGNGINRVEVSLDGGRSWREALLGQPLGPYAYRRFTVQTDLTPPGPALLMCRAMSNTGEKQVDRLKANPGGYHNNLPRPIPVVVV
jgi:sulfite dehydrogenase (cytochrome) subunit A